MSMSDPMSTCAYVARHTEQRMSEGLDGEDRCWCFGGIYASICICRPSVSRTLSSRVGAITIRVVCCFRTRQPMQHGRHDAYSRLNLTICDIQSLKISNRHGPRRCSRFVYRLPRWDASSRAGCGANSNMQLWLSRPLRVHPSSIKTSMDGHTFVHSSIYHDHHGDSIIHALASLRCKEAQGQFFQVNSDTR